MGFFKRSGIYLASNILNALVPFLLLPILTRHLTTAEYGQVAMFQTVIIGLTALAGLNTVGAANRKYYDSDHKLLPIFNGACLQILSISVLFLALIVYFLGGRIGKWLNIPEIWVYLSLIAASSNYIIQLRLGQWQVREQAMKFGIMQVSQSILMFALSVLFVVSLCHGAEGRVEAFLITTSVFALLSILLLYKNRLVKISVIKKDYIFDALKFGVPLIPHVVGIFFLSSVDRFYINKELGISEAGIYMFAVQLSLGVAVVFDAVNKALLTWLFKSLAENQTQQLQRVVQYTYLFFIVVLFLGCLSFIVGPWVVKIIGGPGFEKAGTVIGWLCLGQAFGGMYLMVTNYVFYAKKTARLSLVTISTGIINVILLIFLLKLNGIVGVAMAFALSMLLRFVGTWLIAISVSDFSWRISLHTIIKKG